MSNDDVDFGSGFVEVRSNLSQDRTVRETVETVLEERNGSLVRRSGDRVGTTVVGNRSVEERVETEDRERVRECVKARLDDQHSVMVL
jgi:hypothetical protein